MTEKAYPSRVADKIVYPTWKALLNLISETKEAKNIGFPDASKAFEHIPDLIKNLREYHLGFAPNFVMDVVAQSEANYFRGIPIEEVQESMERFQFGSNEFHTVYDMKTASYSYVSPRVEAVLGIKPENFTVEKLYASGANKSLIHSEDLSHVLRWGNLAYIVLSLKGFSFRANDDHYLIRHRISVEESTRKNMRDLGYILIEKRCYLCHEGGDTEKIVPSMHLDRWTVLENSASHTVRPLFITSPDQSILMNATLYLLNAMLLDVPIKYIMLLNERTESDRNKAIANSVSDKLNFYSGLVSELDDKSVADCFAKTIRPRMREIVNTWLPQCSRFSVDTDVDALKAAQKLGLVPIQPMVEQMLYSSITEL